MTSGYLVGGLGNQMFVVATATALALRTGDDCAFDLGTGNFVHHSAKEYVDNIFSKITPRPLTGHPFEHVYQEPHFHYSPIPSLRNTMIRGYFQSDKYFSDFDKEIRRLFLPEEVIRKMNEKWGDIISGATSVHVRRGDYLKITEHHPTLSVDYYKEALVRIGNVRRVIVFSDDLDWCQNNLRVEGIEFVFVDGQRDYEDLVLMSLCQNHVMANSSFSWWGSWLNERSNKIVVAPKTWFGPSYRGTLTKDLYYQNVVVI